MRLLSDIFVKVVINDHSYKLVTVVEGDQKAPLSIATTSRCTEGRYSFPWITPLYLLIHTLYCWVLSKGVSSIIFKVFGMTRPGIEPRSPGPWRTLYPVTFSCEWALIFIYTHKQDFTLNNLQGFICCKTPPILELTQLAGLRIH